MSIFPVRSFLFLQKQKRPRAAEQLTEADLCTLVKVPTFATTKKRIHSDVVPIKTGGILVQFDIYSKGDFESPCEKYQIQFAA